MATKEIFTNNVETILSAGITSIATEITVPDASIFNFEIKDGDGITYGFHEVATITNGTNIEIVHITDANTTTNILTVIRAQEGTTGFAFAADDAIETRVTADTMNGGWYGREYSWEQGNPGLFSVDLVTLRSSANHKSGGDYSIAIGSKASAMSVGSIAIGKDVVISETTLSSAIAIGLGATININGVDSIAIGEWAACDDLDCVAVGPSSSAEIDGAVAVGRGAYATGKQSIAIGKYAADNASTFIGGIAIGSEAYNYAQEGIILGFGSTVATSATQGISLGSNIDCNVAKTHVITGMSAIQADNAQTDEVTFFSGQETIVFSQIVDFKTIAGDVVAITLPVGGTFFPNEVGFIPTAVTTSTGNPTITFGITGDSTAIVASMVTTVDTVRDRDIAIVNAANNGGVTSLTMSVTTGATATTFLGRVYFKGIMLED